MKNAISKKTNTELVVTALPPAPQLDAAGQINHFNRVAREAGELAVQAAIITGWMLSVEKAKRAGTFMQWCEANLEFSYRTGTNYMTLFAKTVASRGEIDMECSTKARTDLVREYAEGTDSKTLTELYVDLGIVKKTPSNMGGHREGAGRKRKLTDEQMAEQAAAIAQDPVLAYREVTAALDAVEAFVIARDGLGLLGNAEIGSVAKRLTEFISRAQEILNARAAAKKVVRK